MARLRSKVTFSKIFFSRKIHPKFFFEIFANLKWEKIKTLFYVTYRGLYKKNLISLH